MLIIGENINASNRLVGEAIASRNREFLDGMARAQAAAGANFIDVNAGIGRERRQLLLQPLLRDPLRGRLRSGKSPPGRGARRAGWVGLRKAGNLQLDPSF